jgi:SAM-dependent methyltransferase
VKPARDISTWWADHPMTYGTTHGEPTYADGAQALGSREFFARVDAQFYDWNRPLHGDAPFDRLFPYDRFAPAGRVLEIGCGMGTMAMNWARRGARMTAVDLNPVAVEQTRRRFDLLALEGEVREADSRELPFPDASFDYVYSWGVLHHSPDLPRSIGELFRVLRPGGGFGVMVYHRRSFLHWYMIRYVEGFLHFEDEFLDPLELASRYGDAAREEGNPHTWPVTRGELMAQVRPQSDDASIQLLGTDLDSVLVLMTPGLGSVMPAWMKKPWARRFGWSLWASGHRR